MRALKSFSFLRQLRLMKPTIKNQAIAMAELRVSESAARADSDRLRSRIANLEKGARTAADRDAIRCLQLGAECRRLLQEARGVINYCRKTFGGENTRN